MKKISILVILSWVIFTFPAFAASPTELNLNCDGTTARTGGALTPVAHNMSCYFDFTAPVNVLNCVFRSTVKSTLPRTYENNLSVASQNAAGALLAGDGIEGVVTKSRPLSANVTLVDGSKTRCGE